MYAAGLTTLEAMFLATPGDIAATTGIPEPLAAQIVERFRAYREQVKATVPDATRARERERIAELDGATAPRARRVRARRGVVVARLRGAEEGAAQGRASRRCSTSRWSLHVSARSIASRELERLPFEKKLAHLESFLEEARDKYVAQP